MREEFTRGIRNFAVAAVVVGWLLGFSAGYYVGTKQHVAPLPGYGISVGSGAASQPTTTAIDRGER